MFIASSREALPVARAVRSQFDHDVDVDIWNEGTFAINEGALESLLNLSAFYDFAVAIFTQDDRARIREREVAVTRDNVIFEFGLFLGSLGPHRAFFIAEEGVDVFSDWAGVTTTEFAMRDNLDAAVGAACDQVRGEMEIVDELTTFSLLPSTSLAFAYYNNFLKNVLDSFRIFKSFQILERDEDGHLDEEHPTEVRIGNRRPFVTVELPDQLRGLERDGLAQRTRDYRQIVLKTEARTYPLYIAATSEVGDDGDLELIDIPTILLASNRALERIFGEAFLARHNRRSLIEQREIANFELTLLKLIHNAAQDW